MAVPAYVNGHFRLHLRELLQNFVSSMTPFVCDGIFSDCYTKCKKSKYIFDIRSVQDSAFLLKFHDIFRHGHLAFIFKVVVQIGLWEEETWSELG